MTVVFLSLFFSGPVRRSKTWRATVTPLASIIGSGFLVVAPLMWMLAGFDSIWFLLGILLIAYAVGSVVRFNIQYIEPMLGGHDEGFTFRLLNDLSYFSLGLSYIISIAFYVRILSAFVLKGFSLEDAFFSNLLTTVILVTIGGVGYLYGFRWLEKMTEFSVNIKVSVILVFLSALLFYDWQVLDFHPITPSQPTQFSWKMIRQVFGVLLIVQGFEISRYMGQQYSREMRIKTMKSAQVISSLIYFTFVYLILFLMPANEPLNETEIIDLGKNVSQFLPLFITIGAVFSQFSAAIADTIGSGGIITEYTKNRLSQNHAYLLISILTILLIWSADIFEIISYASRSFAAYYLCQCCQAVYANQIFKIKGFIWTLYFTVIAFLMGLFMVFGLPAEV